MNIRITNNSPFLNTNRKNLVQKGLSAILIVNDSGLPIYIRNFSQLKSNSNDELVFSAFISSLSNFIKIYDNDELKGFSTSTNQFYIKTVREIIYCFALNENIYALNPTQPLHYILENALDELIKSFSIYYKMTKTKDFIESNFLDAFNSQIDTILLFNLNKAKHSTNFDISKRKDLYLQNSEEFLSETFHHTFLKHGILGLYVINQENEPIIIRDYVINQKYLKQTEYYQRIVLTLKRFNHFDLGTIRDVGIGDSRIIVKEESNQTICLILSERFYWKHNSNSLERFLKVLLKDLPISSKTNPSFTYNYKENTIKSEILESTNYQVDRILFKNLNSAKEFL